MGVAVRKTSGPECTSTANLQGTLLASQTFPARRRWRKEGRSRAYGSSDWSACNNKASKHRRNRARSRRGRLETRVRIFACSLALFLRGTKDFSPLSSRLIILSPLLHPLNAQRKPLNHSTRGLPSRERERELQSPQVHHVSCLPIPLPTESALTGIIGACIFPRVFGHQAEACCCSCALYHGSCLCDSSLPFKSDYFPELLRLTD